ncbi:CPBP family intramembrane glutamic endopeptidase [Tenacibaculum insulae]|uniref:CPBP family intramembrane glutamic endopeptidase n=1 Tax=Tenacibaculum insulae TaxID=2029677 RepID=UPI003AB2F40C
MKETFNELVCYLKNPVSQKDANTNNSYRFNKFLHLLVISIITGIAITPLFALIEHLNLVDQHAMEELMKTKSKWYIAIFAIVAAPLFEELIFRAPITLLKEKSFKKGFYLFAIAFGLIHITNFKISTNVILLAPILVAPQTILGGYLGFIRVRFGLQWSILLHASYNAFFVLLSFAVDL